MPGRYPSAVTAVFRCVLLCIVLAGVLRARANTLAAGALRIRVEAVGETEVASITLRVHINLKASANAYDVGEQGQSAIPLQSLGSGTLALPLWLNVNTTGIQATTASLAFDSNQLSLLRVETGEGIGVGIGEEGSHLQAGCHF